MTRTLPPTGDTRIWSLRKAYSRSAMEEAEALSSDNFWVKLEIVFSVEGGWRHEELLDLSAISYDEVTKRYTFCNCLCLTPSVQGMIQELECMQRGLLYQNNEMRSALVIVIRALSMFWH